MTACATAAQYSDQKRHMNSSSRAGLHCTDRDSRQQHDHNYHCVIHHCTALSHVCM